MYRPFNVQLFNIGVPWHFRLGQDENILLKLAHEATDPPALHVRYKNLSL